MKFPKSILALAMFAPTLYANDLIITGVADATLTGGTPKVVEIYAVNDIADLSVCGIGSANNGGGTDGEEFTFSATDSITAGEYLYIATESDNFQTFFGFAPNYETGVVAINGDDAIELFCNGAVVDTFGDINTDGSGETWEYLDGWAYRKTDTGPEGSTFTVDNWTYSGVDALEGASTNALATTPFPIGSFSGTSDNSTPTPIDTTPVNTLEIGTCLDDATLISAVQGNGDTSPLVGDTVVVEAIVTGSFDDISGFFLQEEDADMDADSTTSEGVFVEYTGTLPTTGEVVRVLGSVSEAFGKTKITATEVVTGCAAATPSTASFSLPFTDLAEIEALEGMLVTNSQELVVTNNFTLGRFGEASLSSKQLFTPTNIHTPGSDEAIALEAANALDVILLDDGSAVQNADFIPFPTGGLSAANSLRTGSGISSLTGVVDYNFSAYRVIPTIDPTFVDSNPRTSEPEIDEGNLKIASLNVLNYFTGLDAGPSICGPEGTSGCRGAENEIEFERQKAKTVAAIVAMDADILGLMEIENNGFGEDSAIVDLVNGVNAIAGEGTYSVVESAAPIGSDAITVALIYKSAVVALDGELAVLSSSNSISDDDGVLFDDGRNRPALVQAFTLLENDERIAISVNHLKSKGSSCGDGDDDVTTGQGNCNLTRTRAAQALTSFIAAEFPETPTVIIGDLNSYAKEAPIRAIEDAGYTNLVTSFNGEFAYSYSFDGRLGTLDHALANQAAFDKVIDVTEWHINADEPISLDYNTNFKSDDQIINYYAADAYRMSDHDPVLISLQLGEAEVVEEPPVVVEETENSSSGGSLDFLWLGLLAGVAMRLRKRS